MVPRILHRCVPQVVPEPYQTWWEQWKKLHPGWSTRTWVNGEYPELFPLLSHRWKECSSGAQMADLVRIEAVYNEGGVYVDWDFEPFRPVDDLCYHPLWFGTEDDRWLANAIFGSEPGNPLLLEVIKHLQTCDLTPPPNISTGPQMLTAILGARRRTDFHVVPSRLFFPVKFRERGRQGEDFSLSGAYAVHHWSWTWRGTGKKG